MSEKDKIICEIKENIYKIKIFKIIDDEYSKLTINHIKNENNILKKMLDNMKKKVECRKCRVDTKTRVVINRNPLTKIDEKLPEGYAEFYCSNIIKFKKKGRNVNDWITEECRNRIIVKKI